MTEADRVHSTPPLNSSQNSSEGLSRRNMLGALAVLPAAMPPAAEIAAAPIFTAIERHKQAADVWDAAVEVWARFPDGPEPMSMERRLERDRINDAWSDARDALDDAGVDLINTRPTTLHGIARRSTTAANTWCRRTAVTCRMVLHSRAATIRK
jgi:hypothetical protein